MKLYIPELGTRLVLIKDWAFTLYAERRNLGLFTDNSELRAKKKELKDKLNKLNQLIHEDLDSKCPTGQPRYSYCLNDSIHYAEYDKVQKEYWNVNSTKNIKDKQFTIPKNTVLEVDRIYIRKGASGFSSITFKWIKDGKTVRFWAKLNDVNSIECEIGEKEVKYPNGRFTLHNFQKANYLEMHWVAANRLPTSGRRYSGISFQYVDGVVKDVKYQNNSFGKSNHYDSLDKMIAGAKRLNYPESLISAFVGKFNNKD